MTLLEINRIFPFCELSIKTFGALFLARAQDIKFTRGSLASRDRNNAQRVIALAAKQTKHCLSFLYRETRVGKSERNVYT